MSDVFKIIKSIQALPKKTLNHTEKNLLICLAIRFGKNGYVWFTNKELGEFIDEDGEYIKNLISKLKRKNFINVEGRKSNRKIFPGQWFVRDHQSQTKNVRDHQSRSGDSQSQTKNLPLYKEKKEKPLPLNYQLQALKISVPKKVRHEVGITFVFKDGIDAIGFDNMKNLILDMRSESHTDFMGVLKKRIKTAGYAH